MRAVVQRVLRAHVHVDGVTVGEIDRGLLVYLGCAIADTETTGSRLLDKILGLRIFENDLGKLDVSVLDAVGSMLVVSQFTLYANTSKGRRPSFEAAMNPEPAEHLYNTFIQTAALRLPVASGKFRANMQVFSVVDGPFTLQLEQSS
jgi:D-aminoacyl-tRNA deacylase